MVTSLWLHFLAHPVDSIYHLDTKSINYVHMGVRT